MLSQVLLQPEGAARGAGDKVGWVEGGAAFLLPSCCLPAVLAKSRHKWLD